MRTFPAPPLRDCLMEALGACVRQLENHVAVGDAVAAAIAWETVKLFAVHPAAKHDLGLYWRTRLARARAAVEKVGEVRLQEALADEWGLSLEARRQYIEEEVLESLEQAKLSLCGRAPGRQRRTYGRAARAEGA